ncbi:endonuclease domain-containing protein [uncultured Lamprocystis sp.]|uniref:endonuclease domain-containing protein n=1 Tax=uncultured Lamprocystis sp. TaxID=543132 RepID=UPI0025DB1DBB|nr:endonuclease domain-containing protein [uncultured Lamprocystis sp.]
MTDAERRLWYHLRAGRLGVHFRRQAPIGPYIVDFAAIDRCLVVELDGGQHAEPDQADYDKARTAYLEGRGFRVLRFWNNEVLENTEGVLERILEALSNSSSLSPWPPPPRGEGEEERPCGDFSFSLPPRGNEERPRGDLSSSLPPRGEGEREHPAGTSSSSSPPPWGRGRGRGEETQSTGDA